MFQRENGAAQDCACSVRLAFFAIAIVTSLAVALHIDEQKLLILEMVRILGHGTAIVILLQSPRGVR